MRKKSLTRTDCDILSALQVNAYEKDESIGKKVHRSRSVVLGGPLISVQEVTVRIPSNGAGVRL